VGPETAGSWRLQQSERKKMVEDVAREALGNFAGIEGLGL
jgi:hypothetical protein